jgi:peptidoglycan/LPS O-acetylase OafA/YrhL
MDVRISPTEGMIVVLEFALAIGGFMGGVALLTATDGANLGWTVASLEGTPFSDYSVPALILLALNGIFPLFVAIAALQRRPWSAWGHLVLGSVSVAWIGAQVLMLGYISLLQPIFGAIAFLIATLGLVVVARTRDPSPVREQARSGHHGVPSGMRGSL